MIHECDWKMVPEESYNAIIGQPVNRCGEKAAVRLIRKGRNKDLYLCWEHGIRHQAIYGTYLPCELIP